ncbi:hypothetical protein SAE02_76240 [Skermanella aerolata]|uniref:Uncharacterized protein n=1 Tax=Skermanella aerolata TaxID=393310 RepID=A0A512E421_9PROT|nr:hypothetical protein N826_40980 [Skermanella aerolata KACC 11604]GEO43476.1 hypothetical protein SAE02_76240 [Skermanella aerolata]
MIEEPYSIVNVLTTAAPVTDFEAAHNCAQILEILEIVLEAPLHRGVEVGSFAHIH